MRKKLKILHYRFQLWRMEARFSDLDLDMTYSNMTYVEYGREHDLLSDLSYEIRNKLKELRDEV